MYQEASLAPRARLIGLGAVLVVAAFAVLLVPRTATAGELFGNNFCQGVTLGHLNGPNDYCTSSNWEYNKFVRGASGEHSTCVSTTTNGEKSGVNVSWACSAGPGYEILNSVNEWAITKSIIRNNTTGDSEQVTAVEWWCEGGPPC